MCDPVTAMALAGAGAQAGGGVLKAVGAAQAGLTAAKNDVASAEFDTLQAQALGYRAEAASSNLDLLKLQADVARGNVTIAEAKGAIEASRVARAAKDVAVGQNLHFSYGNLDPAFGSPLVAAMRSAAEAETDIGLTRASTMIAVAGAKTQVASIEQEALGQAYAAVEARQNAILTLKRSGTELGNVSAHLAAGRLGAATALLTGVAGAGLTATKGYATSAAAGVGQDFASGLSVGG